MKYLSLAIMGAVAVLGFAPGASAFHSGNVAECEGCHTMHNSSDGKAVTTAFPQFQSGPYLLKGSDQSSACLNCHQSNQPPPDMWVSTDPSVMGPGVPPLYYTAGGDFGWLRKSYGSGRRAVPGERHGHNVIANDYGLVADSTLTTAPGGSYPASALGCQSCHDPHGKYRRLVDGTFVTTGLPTSGSGSYGDSNVPIANVSAVGAYRILGGIGYQPKSLSGAFAFTVNPPDAIAGATQDEASWNRTEPTIASQTHVVYGRGMSEFCANCHTQMLQESYTSGMKGLRHPAGNNGKLTAPIAAIYNAYVSSGRLTNSDPTTAYSTLVPFEVGTGDYTVLKGLVNTGSTFDGTGAGNYTADINLPATTSNNVSCLTCHRAHASGFPSAIRYFIENQFMTKNAADGTAITYNGPSGMTQAELTAAYYGRPASQFGPWARVQCNKCHGKD